MSDKRLNAAELKSLTHWALFGQAGRPSSRRVTASEWETKPFSKPERVPWRVPIPAEKLGTLLNGFCPEKMEDKWFVYADYPDAYGLTKLHMYRSWTGFKVFELEVTMDGNEDAAKDGWRAVITAIKFEKDTDRAGDRSDEEAKNEALQVCEWVLGVTLEEQR